MDFVNYKHDVHRQTLRGASMSISKIILMIFIVAALALSCGDQAAKNPLSSQDSNAEITGQPRHNFRIKVDCGAAIPSGWNVYVVVTLIQGSQRYSWNAGCGTDIIGTGPNYKQYKYSVFVSRMGQWGLEVYAPTPSGEGRKFPLDTNFVVEQTGTPMHLLIDVWTTH